MAVVRVTAFERAAQATLVGNSFDDAATGQGLLNFFLRGIACGALSEEQTQSAGITVEELRGRSFARIVANRAKDEERTKDEGRRTKDAARSLMRTSPATSPHQSLRDTSHERCRDSVS